MSIDPARVEEFAKRMVEALNASALVFMTSIGHRTGVLDALADHPDTSSAELARAARLDERYVREWLAAMTCAGVVEYDATRMTYRLPPEHAACLTRAAAPNNLAVYAQYFPTVGSVEDDLVRCFSEGGGIPYERYPRFHEVMAEDSAQTVLSALFDAILPLIPGLSDRLERGARVADLGCGRGRAILMLAERYPESRFVGIDLSSDAIEHACGEARRRGLANAEFVARDLSDLDRSADAHEFDLVTTFDAVHDQPSPRSLLRGIRRMLRHDGVYLMQDVHSSSELHDNLANPFATLLYFVSCAHCVPVSLAQGGEGLGTMWGIDTAHRMLKEEGFESVRVHRLEHDPMNDYVVAHP
jgi:2-polyprenyl-3-methyl-5-hydroxy-6-metoxy-1,4-benzoquinol methylase